MADSPLLKEKRQAYAAKVKLVEELDVLSRGSDGKRDMSKKELLDKVGATDAKSAKEKIDAHFAEMSALGDDVDQLHDEARVADLKARKENLNQPNRPGVPATISNDGYSFGSKAVETKGFMEAMREKRMFNAQTVDIDLKTLLQTSAGFQPRVDNGSRVVDKVIRPVQILDLIPSDNTEAFEIAYMEETTRTQAAAELAEAGTYQEDAFVFTRRNSVVKKIGSEIPVTDEQLADVGQMRALLDNRLAFGLQARLDLQVIMGDGTGSTLTGINSASGLQTQAKAADPAANAIFKAITLCRITGRAQPNAIVMHGTDWQNVRLAQNAQGDYQFGPPTVVGADTMWGLPVAQFEGTTAGSAWVGDFARYSQLYYRKGIDVQVGFINDQFIKGQVTLRGDVRAAFCVYRGAAFCKVTGL